jgi:hypothetical protein
VSELRERYELARPFPDSMVEKKPGGKFEAAYVSHGTVTARLLEVIGPFDWSISKIITNADGIAVGCIGRLEVVVDGRPVVIEEVGDCEHPGANSASNLKSSSSDALKRAAMRLGLGLHLWQGDSYYLHRSLEKRLNAALSDEGPSEGGDTGEAPSGAQTTLQSVSEDVAW